MIAFLRRLAARIECAVGHHVQPREGVRHEFQRDHWQCARCHEWVTVHRGPK